MGGDSIASDKSRKWPRGGQKPTNRDARRVETPRKRREKPGRQAGKGGVLDVARGHEEKGHQKKRTNIQPKEK